MNPRAGWSVAIFAGVIAQASLLLIAYDAWVFAKYGSAGTISWGLAVLGLSHPIVPFAWGLFVGAGGIGLAFHFWFSATGSVQDQQELARLRLRVQELEFKLYQAVNR